MAIFRRKKYVYSFKEGNKDMRDILGGKGANLAEMTNIGLPVPQGFTVTCEACNKYYADGMKISDSIIDQIYAKMDELEEITGKTIIIKNTVDAAILGGMKLRYLGQQIDGSIKTKLDKFDKSLKDLVI